MDTAIDEHCNEIGFKMGARTSLFYLKLAHTLKDDHRGQLRQVNQDYRESKLQTDDINDE